MGNTRKSRFERLLLMVSLLNHRNYVTIDSIVDLCGVSKRTVFRDIQIISSANIPVYFDKNVKGYRLTRRDTSWPVSPRVDEIVLMVVALKLLSHCVNQSYRESIDLLLKKIISMQDFELEKYIKEYDFDKVASGSNSDLSSGLTSITVCLAISMSKSLKLILQSERTEANKMIIDDPRLCFSGAWKLSEKKSDSEKLESLDKVIHASLK